MIRRQGYTIIELVVAIAITAVLALMVFYTYMNITAGLQKAQRELALLTSIRSATAMLRGDLRHIVAKSGYVPPPPGDFSAPAFKALNAGLFALHWPGNENHLAGADARFQDGRCRYLGFYTTRDGAHVDRVEFWFNPPEPAAKQHNQLDDDGDDDPNDARNPLHLMRDDRGRLMFRRVPDAQLSLAQYAGDGSGGAPPAGLPAPPPFRAPSLTGTEGSEYDRGEVLVDGLDDCTFEFLFERKGADGAATIAAANCWPFSADLARTDTDLTGLQWPSINTAGRQPQGLSFIALPQAVRITLEAISGAETRRYQYTLELPQSQWHEYLRR